MEEETSFILKTSQSSKTSNNSLALREREGVHQKAEG